MKIQDVGLKFKYALTPLKKVQKVIVHHPAHPTWDINDIHKSHQAKGWNGIGYNYFVTKNGTIQVGRGHNEGAHCKGNSMNDKSLGVSFQGNFEIQVPTEEQYRAGAQLIAKLLQQEGLDINDVDPHKKYDATVCPGKYFDMEKLKEYISEELNPTKKEVASLADTQEYVHSHNDKVMIDLLSKYGYMAKSFKIPNKDFAQQLSITYLMVKDLEDRGLLNSK